MTGPRNRGTAKKNFFWFDMCIWKIMIRNHQNQNFSSFGCTIEKLAPIDFLALHTYFRKIGKNYRINVYEDYTSMSQWIFSSNIPKDRGWAAEKNALFEMLHVIYFLRFDSPTCVETVTIYEYMTVDFCQYICCHFFKSNQTKLDFWYVM